MIRILVTGSTGFLGSHLAKVLAKEGFSVRCFVRNKEKLKTLPKNCEVFIGNITSKQDCISATENVDIVCHLAAQMRERGIPEQQYWMVNVEGTKNILEAAKKKGVRQFIHCSTASIIGPVKGYPLDEGYSSYDCDNIYKLTKAEAEKIVWSSREEIPITILSPEFIYGPGCFHYLSLFQAIKKRRIAIIGDGKNIHQPTYVSDVVDGFLHAINNKKAINEKFIIAGNETVTSEDFIIKIAQKMGVDLKPLHIPLWLAKIISSVLPIPEGTIDFFTKNHMYSIEKAKNVLKYEPKINLDYGLEKTVSWFRTIKV